MSLYVSTTALPGPLPETLDAFEQIDVKQVEYGYCSDINLDWDRVLSEREFECVAHNYFRPVADEFILNLASADPAIRNRSVEYISRCVEFCEAHSIDVYTFHAGFRVDPNLNLKFPDEGVQPHSKAINRFFEALDIILDRTQDTNVNLAIENNMVAPRHRLEDGAKLLFADPTGAAVFLDRLPDRIGVLLDTGHLNVSAETLGFERNAFLDSVASSVRWLHLHDNDGESDNHAPPAPNSWVFDIYERFNGVPGTIEASFENKDTLDEYLKTVHSDIA